MRLAKVSIDSLLFFILCSCIALFSINYEIIPSIRILDILFIILFTSFIFTNPSVNKSLLVIFFFIVLIFFTSNMIGIFLHGSPELARLVFVYKYLFIFTLPWMVTSIVKTDQQIKIINIILLINFVFLSSWTYIYLTLLGFGSIVGSFRPSFPFSNNYMVSDAHLYSSYLGFFLIAYIFYFRRFFNHNFVISFLIIINGFVALILTGSRTGLFMMIFGFFLYGVYIFLSLFFKKKKSLVQKKIITYTTTSILLLASIMIFLTPYLNTIFIDYSNLIERAFNFKLTNDMSSQGRVQQLFIAIEDAENLALLLGMGLLSSLTWYDGIISILIAHGGFLFIFFIYVYYYLIIKKAAINAINQKDFLLFLFLILLYLSANIVTEYIFVTRNAFPILVSLSILFLNIFNERKNYFELIYGNDDNKTL